MATPSIPCPVYAWCDIDHTTPLGSREPDFHIGKLASARVGISEVEPLASVDEDGHAEINLQLHDWYLTPETLDQEFKDLRAIIDQLETSARGFDPNDRLDKGAID